MQECSSRPGSFDQERDAVPSSMEQDMALHVVLEGNVNICARVGTIRELAKGILCLPGRTYSATAKPGQPVDEYVFNATVGR